jgi:secreted PhoX family phosphatase
MIDSTKIRLMALSRRSMLRSLALTAGGAAIFATTMTGTREAAAQAKASQKAVGYQETPHGTQRCDNCKQFIAPSSCKVVEGNINPAGWCKVYIKKPAGT